jgi:VIT1/CCC1 family predicted Fe2+/Mn2+ transporter
MTNRPTAPGEQTDSVLSPVERISEMLFGLFMALTFVGAVSAATAGREEVRTMFIAALGCNLAWGLVDAIMYLVRTATDRGRSLAFMHAVRAARDHETGRRLVERRLGERFILRMSADLITASEIELIRARIAALPAVSHRANLDRDDLLAGLGIFLIVVVSTLPVVVPFLLIADVDLAKNVSRAIALAMLFFGGLALGRYAGYGSWKAGLTMVGLGTGLVIVINALGG